MSEVQTETHVVQCDNEEEAKAYVASLDQIMARLPEVKKNMSTILEKSFDKSLLAAMQVISDGPEPLLRLKPDAMLAKFTGACDVIDAYRASMERLQ